MMNDYGRNKIENENRKLNALLKMANAQNAIYKAKILEQTEKIAALEAEVSRLIESDKLNMRAIRRIQAELKAVQKKLREYKPFDSVA